MYSGSGKNNYGVCKIDYYTAIKNKIYTESSIT